MFTKMYYYKSLCRMMREKLDSYSRDCHIYSIWHFYPPSRWCALKEFVAGGTMVRAEWFPLVYWSVLLISTLGSIYSLLEFASLYFGCRKHVSMWRQRTYYVLPYSLLRKCRVVGALVMLNAWLLLTYAVITISPAYMTPWVTINMCSLAFELLTWTVEVLMGATKLDLHTMLTFLLPSLNLLFVRCVRGVFQHALDTGDTEGLRFWKSKIE